MFITHCLRGYAVTYPLLYIHTGKSIKESTKLRINAGFKKIQ